MRLFFAFDLPSGQPGRLARLVPRVRTGGVRPVEPHLMHVTLRFVGPAGAEMLEALVGGTDSLRPRGRCHVGGLGTFPSSGRPRVLWAGLVFDSDVEALQHDVESLCRRAGCPAEERPWVPHVTLARFRGRPPDWLEPLLARESGLELPPFDVGRVHLMNSVSEGGGVRYESVASTGAL